MQRGVAFTLKNYVAFTLKNFTKTLLTISILSDNIYIREVPVSLLVMSLAKTKPPYRDDVTKRKEHFFLYQDRRYKNANFNDVKTSYKYTTQPERDPVCRLRRYAWIYRHIGT